MNQQELDFGWGNLEDNNKIEKAKEAVAKVTEKKKAAKPMTPEELETKWKEILQNPKNSPRDKERLELTYNAWLVGKVYPQTPKLSKAEAMRMYAFVEAEAREGRLRKMVEEKPENYHLIQSVEQMNWVCDLWKREPIVGFDTETDGLDVVHGIHKMVGLSITFPIADIHVYIPTRHIGEDLIQLDNAYVMEKLKPYLTDKHMGKILHNAKFDAHVLMTEGIRLRGIHMDTMVAMWTLNELEMNYKLKDLSNKYAKFLGMKGGNETFGDLFNGSFADVPLDIALVYAAKDTELTYKFFLFINSQFNREELHKVRDLYYELENPLIDVCILMEQSGLLLNDSKTIDKTTKELQAIQAELFATVQADFGDVNFNSPQQLQVALYDVKKFPDISKKRSTAKETLQKLAVDYPEVETLLEYRAITKLLSSFIEKLPTLMKATGRVYGQFKQNGTKTGRFSAIQPNLQQIPEAARKIFTAPEGFVIIGGDFSQIEPRVLAHMSGDEELQRPYVEGFDLYSTLASKTFNVPLEDCGDKSKYRKMMKTGLLSVMYGTSAFTLAKQMKVSFEEAEKFIADFIEAYPIVVAWGDSVQEFAKENEFVETLYGRKRRFPNHKPLARNYDKLKKQILAILGTKKLPSNIWDEEFKSILPYNLKRSFQDVKRKVEGVRRQTVNARVQGTAADIMKRAMIRLAALCEKYEQDGWKMLATVHDEALLEVPDTITKAQIAEVEEAMTGAAELVVPLKVDIAFMKQWGNDISKEKWFAAA